MSRELSAYINDILDNLRLCREFISEMSYEEFSADNKTIYAVLRSLEVIGEAAKNVPDNLKVRNPLVPWKEMAGMRDRLIHAYFGVSVSKVWNTATNDVPTLTPLIENILRELQS